jgi:hypothetical protein
MHSLAREFSSISFDDPPYTKVQAACRAYAAATGSSVSWPMTLEESTAVRRWLIQQAPTGAAWHDYLIRQPWVHWDAAAKASWAQQAPYIICNIIPPDGGPPFPVPFPIPVRPFTKQVRHSSQYLTDATRKALKNRPADKVQPIEAWQTYLFALQWSRRRGIL